MVYRVDEDVDGEERDEGGDVVLADEGERCDSRIHVVGYSRLTRDQEGFEGRDAGGGEGTLGRRRKEEPGKNRMEHAGFYTQNNPWSCSVQGHEHYVTCISCMHSKDSDERA